MSSRFTRAGKHTRAGRQLVLTTAWMLAVAPLVGCQDGPMYALKHANPYFVLKEWREDAALGITDHERRRQLQSLAGSIGKLPAERQQYWNTHLEQLVEHDPSSEMRRIAVQAAGNMTAGAGIAIIEQGLDDDIAKVRMEACRALSKRRDEPASRMLAAVIGSETNQDVKHAAMDALSNHHNAVATDSLRLALQDRNPATRKLAIQSLRGATGKDYGNDPQVWIAALDGEPVEQRPPGLTDRLRNLF